MGYKVKKIFVGTQQVRPKTIPLNGLLGYRPLETDVNDQSGNGKNLTKTGCSFGTVGSKLAIRLGTSFSSNPTNYLKTPDIGKPTTYSFSGWVYKTNTDTSGTNSWQSIWENATADTANALRFRARYNELRFISYNTVQNTYSLTPNNRTHIGVTSDGSTMKVYINGNLYGSYTAGTNTTDSTGVYNIGRGYGGGSNYRGWCGWVRQFLFYNKVLTDDDMTTIYNLTQ